MNERILKLANEARTYAETKPHIYQVAYDKKFAELVVRECANICFSEAESHSMAFGEHCGVVIKEHFGVE